MSAHCLIVWGSIKGFLFVRSGAGQDWRIDRAGGESMGPARQLPDRAKNCLFSANFMP